ncbi:MAG: hypothetical protein ABIQ47_10090 [Tepidiformaceae bacterium]
MAFTPAHAHAIGLQGGADPLVELANDIERETASFEEWRFVTRYRDRLASHLARRYRGVRPLVLGNMPALIEALDDGVVVDAIVDGDQIEPLAHGRLADLGVISFVSRIAQSA